MCRGQAEHELDKELRFHLEQQIEENIALGMLPVEARFAALRRLGGITQVEEECREMRRTDYLENLWHDLRYTLRTFAKSPGFAVVIVLTLALSIGANSAIFSVINGVLLRPLPYPQADRIVRIFFSSDTYPKFPLNPFDFLDFRHGNRSFESIAAFTRGDLQLSDSGQPVRLAAFRVTAGYFRVLGLRPARGREFNTKDELPGNGQVVILSDRVWRSRFAADPNIVGRKIILDSQPFTVAGVMPQGVDHPGNGYHAVAYGDTVDVWWPFTFEGNSANRGSHYLEGIGRLKTGLTSGKAQAEMNLLVSQLEHEHPKTYTGWRVLVIPLYREIVGPTQRMLLVLLGTVALVLLIACANAANLLLARATARQREIAVRSALGAGRSRLIRQMLAESLVIALFGGAFGATIAVAGVRGLVSLLPATFPRANAIHVNAVVFLFTLLVSLATGLLFGLAPALQASRTDLQQGLREGGRGSTSGGSHVLLRSVLVVSEVSLACILLIGAGLMLRSFVNLLQTDPGFRTQHVLTASVSLPLAQYKTGEAAARFSDQLVQNLNAIHGVEAAGAGTDLPWTGYDENAGGWTIEDKKPAPNEESHARYHAATPDYFRALGIPLIRGRFFTERDNKITPQVLIINASMAKRYWPHGDALGKRITFSDTPKEKDWMTIVGIVGDVKDAPNSKGAESAFWWPFLQQQPSSDLSLVIRGDSDPALLVSQLRVAVRRLDPALAVADIRLMDQIADASVATPRFGLFLVGLFAALALTLAAIGIYGVISYSVSQRTHEFGMRIALGAQSWDVLGLVLAQGVKLAILGVGVGVICALALARILGNLLYEVSPADPVTFAAVSLGAMAIAVLACYVPARRATEADPMVALRCE
jgi:predicted permease